MNRIDPDTISDEALIALLDTHPNADAAMQRFNVAYAHEERADEEARGDEMSGDRWE